MATTTATITLSSSDLLTDNLSLSATTTLYKGGTTATGLEQLNYHRAKIATGTNFDLIPESDALKDNSNYVYIINKNTDVTNYVIISINSEVVGRLYAGDWAFFPWSCDLSAAANDSTIELQAYVAEATVEYALFHVGETLATASDS
jgi:sulfur carrier protein ThiS